jgi:hypothetical protein
MNSLKLLKWSGIGLLSILVVVLFIGLAVPAIVTAQQGNPNEAFSQDGQSSIRSDDPLGRNNIPAPENSALAANNPLQSSQEIQEEVKGGGGPVSVLIIPGADFGSDGDFSASAMFRFSEGSWEGSDSFPCLTAPVYVPNNTTIMELMISAIDNDPTYNLWVTLYKVNNEDGISTVIATVSTTGASAAIQMPYANPYDVVSYPTYSYYLGTCLSSNSMNLYSAQVWYDR